MKLLSSTYKFASFSSTDLLPSIFDFLLTSTHFHYWYYSNLFSPTYPVPPVFVVGLTPIHFQPKTNLPLFFPTNPLLPIIGHPTSTHFCTTSWVLMHHCARTLWNHVWQCYPTVNLSYYVTVVVMLMLRVPLVLVPTRRISLTNLPSLFPRALTTALMRSLTADSHFI